MSQMPLIQIRDLSRDFAGGGVFSRGQKTVHAVRDICLNVPDGGTLGIVGESGCGKSTLGRVAVGLLPPTAGDVLIKGQSLWRKTEHKDYRAFRQGLAGVIQMVFQDPYSSLNPRMRVEQSVAEPLLCSRAWWREGTPPTAADVKKRVSVMLEQVGLDSGAGRRYPHEFSGGQRQRIAIARALVTRPAFVVCDEPTSSLDASVQSQVLNLLKDMQDDLGLTYLFISHDLAVVRHMSDRVAVMYRGLLVEEGDAESLFTAPGHPYTRLLLASVPGLENRPEHVPDQALEEAARRNAASAEAPSSRGEGCPFAPRCSECMPRCLEGLPELIAIGDGSARHLVRCRLYEEGPA